MKKLIICAILSLSVISTAFAESARDIVDRSYRYMRGETSVAKIRMKIHRPDYERTITVNAWSKGRTEAIFVVTLPKKDEGNGTLKKGRQMWTYNPRINRIIKLPSSMMSQGWMGSDFSNNDLSKTESMIDDYTHQIKDTKIINGKRVCTIESIPLEDAAVVWGRVIQTIREDGIMLKQLFQDQDMISVKELATSDIKPVSGKLFPMIWTMTNMEEDNRYTEVEYFELEFDKPLPDRIFTKTYMQNLGE